MKNRKSKIENRILLAFLGFLLIVPATFASFNDVSDSHINVDAIDYVREQGIVKGYDDGAYRPERKINRAEFTKIVLEAQFSRDEIDGCVDASFSDVNKEDWFATYVCLAVKKGIINGYSDNTFRPGREISFVEAAKIIVIALGSSTEPNEVWYRPYVEKLGEEKSIPDSISTFDKQITRGEMAEMIYRLKAKVRNKSSRNYNQLVGISDDSNNDDKMDKEDDSSVNQKESDSAQASSDKEAVESTEVMIDTKIDFSGKVLAGVVTPLLDFNQADYDAAIEADKTVLLYFYASWCPICRDEVQNATYPAFAELENESVVGFRVNFNDGDTDNDEKELARAHGVAYQHTKVIVQGGERVLKSPEKWTKERYSQELDKLIK